MFPSAHLLVHHLLGLNWSRSNNKNGGAQIEQKNWTQVRGLVGYLRFDTDQELALLKKIMDTATALRGRPASVSWNVSHGARALWREGA